MNITHWLSLPALVFSALSLSAQPNTDIYLVSVTRAGSNILLDAPVNVTARPGYDNQPQFLPDSSGFLYSAIHDGQADVFLYRLEDAEVVRLTTTPESEYSPTPTRDGSGYTVVRVEPDSTQRIWLFPLDSGSPELLLPDVQPVGYQAWAFDNTLALYVLGDPPVLQIANAETGETSVAAENIGVSIQKIPLQRAVSFIHHMEDGTTSIDRYDVPTGTVSPLAQPLDGVEHHTWMPDGTTILMASGSRIYSWEPAGKEWTPLREYGPDGISEISRMAVSPDGRWMVFVAAE